MICKVIKAVEQHSMFDGKSITVGVSGGADSVALLHVLFTLQGEYGYSLKAAHVNHMLRGEEADRDEAFVRSFCASLGVPLDVLKADVNALSKERRIGLEECGRQVRYEFFESLGCDLIATAHTLTDCVETMIFNLARGTTSAGLCSIPAKRGKIIRPLIFCTAEEVKEYCRENSLDYVTDSSNLSDEYARNKIRHGVLPVLSSINPAFEANALRCIESLKADESYLSTLAANLLNDAKSSNGYDVSILSSAPLPVRYRALARILEEQSEATPEKKHVEALDELLVSGGDRVLCGSLLCRQGGGLLYFPGKEASLDPWCIPAVIGENITPAGVCVIERITREEYEKLPKKEKLSCFDAQCMKFELVFRSRRAGDSFTSPLRHNTKTLKKLFNELAIQPHRRNHIRILASGDELVWFETQGVSAKFSVTKKTNVLLRIKEQ